MPELTDLQKSLLKAIKDNLQNNICTKTSFQLFQAMRIKPATESYISEMVADLEKKGKIKFETRYVKGHQGKKRTITLL
jgi:Mn-dependent DtxR family transcriptional regulator